MLCNKSVMTGLYVVMRGKGGQKRDLGREQKKVDSRVA